VKIIEALRSAASYKAAVRVIESITRAMSFGAVGIIVVMMMLTVCDVFSRFFRPIIGTVELTEYMLVVLAFLGMAWCGVRLRHVRVELLRLPPRVQNIIDTITYFAGLGICVIMAWQTFLECMRVRQLDLVSSFLKVPKFPFYGLLALGLSMLSLVMVNHLVQSVVKLSRGR
jgi:TRAP-type C4-dicarboxylate transport system permease small subunit